MDPNLERNTTVCQGLETMNVLPLLCQILKNTGIVQKVVLKSSLTKKENTLILRVHNVLNYNVLNKC